MTPETKSEIIVVAIAGAVLAFIWARNRNAGTGTGLEGLPSLNLTGPAVPPAASFNIPAPVPGISVDYSQSPWSLPAPGNYSLDAGAPSACNCQNGSQANSTFGSNFDLASWLSSLPGMVSSYQDALTNWN